MLRSILIFVFTSMIFSFAHAQTMTLSTSSDQYVVTTIFSDVSDFTIDIEIDMPLAAGVYENPPINSVVYQVIGVLEAGTPSGFPAFDLNRDISGTEFYAQGSSLSFEILEEADLSDGVQADELAGDGVIFTLNAREIDNQRFHPALFELNEDGSGRIQNSNNIHTEEPLLEVAFGEEYITDLIFDAGNLTLITGVQAGTDGGSDGGGDGSVDGGDDGSSDGGGGSSGGGSVSFFLLLGLCFLRCLSIVTSRLR